ncbi:hypothetical protein CHUAL_008219 [Chamberlinius hualienensis]
MNLGLFFILNNIAQLIFAGEIDPYDQPGCLYGWQLSKDNTTCSIDCFSDEYTKVNVYCTLDVLKKLNISFISSTVLSMPSGRVVPAKAKFPSCYNILLDSNSGRNVTASQLERLSTEKNATTFCYPLSPQLLQCNYEVVKYGDYQLINSTILLVPSLSIQAGLGDFYVYENNGSAAVCRKTAEFRNIPRCNYITLNLNDIMINRDGSMSLAVNNFTVKNPIYSVITSGGKVHVCFPMSADFGNCRQKLHKLQQYYFSVMPDLNSYDIEIHSYLKPDQYYINTESVMLYCDDTVSVTSLTYYQVFYVYGILSIVAGILLTLTILTSYKFFLQNNHSKYLLCHLVAFAFMFVSFGVRQSFSTSDVWCYVLFSIDYYSMMATYTWLCIVSFDSWIHFSKLPTISDKLCCSSGCYVEPKLVVTLMVGWGIPALFLTTVLSVNLTSSPLNVHNTFTPYFIPGCFFNNMKTAALYYYFPESIFTVTSITFVILTIRNIVSAAKGTELANQRINMQIFLVSVRIVLVMGFCWLVNLFLYFLSFFKLGLIVLWFGTTGTTILQGYVISFMYFPWRLFLRKNASKQKNDTTSEL